nr:DUF1292 domain-containing protein [Helcococcus sueciensis]
MDKFENEDKIYIDLHDGDDVIRLLLIDSFGIEDEEYASLLDEEEEVLYIAQVELNEEEAIFTLIEDEDELEEILSIYSELLDEDEEEI